MVLLQGKLACLATIDEKKSLCNGFFVPLFLKMHIQNQTKMMYKQTLTFTLLAILLVSLFSCEKETPIPPNNGTAGNPIDIGTYSLQEESLAKLPYLNKTQVTFIDSLGNKAVFDIIEQDLFESTGGVLFKYDVIEEGDTVRYAYSNQIKRFRINNDSLNLNFDLALEARPYYPDPEQNYIADVLTIFCKDPNNSLIGTQVFYHETDSRTWPTSWNATAIPEIDFLGRAFLDVYYNDYIDAKSALYFNYEEGIVSFTDIDGRLWRLEDL